MAAEHLRIMAHDILHPTWIDRTAYPFAARTFHHPEGRMHYVDEGSGPVILFVHGTPDWSFGFRHVIAAFAPTHRCIVPDHLGFGLSDKPHGANYTVAAHARRLQDLIAHLGLKDITLVVTDFGGGIGLPHALEHPANVKRLVLYNTWMWDLMPDKRFSGPTAIMKSWLGRFLYLRLGFSVNVMMPNGYGDKKKLDKATHAHYRCALPDTASRAATFACVQEIKNAGSLLAGAMGTCGSPSLHSHPAVLGPEGPLLPARLVGTLEDRTAARYRGPLPRGGAFRA